MYFQGIKFIPEYKKLNEILFRYLTVTLLWKSNMYDHPVGKTIYLYRFCRYAAFVYMYIFIVIKNVSSSISH